MKKSTTLNRRNLLLFAFIGMMVNSTIHSQSICFNSHNDFVFTGASNAQSMDYGDFDNDGVKDIVEGSFTVGSLKMAYIKGNANGTFQAPVYFEAGSRPLDVKAFDFNMDGNMDVVVANQQDATISVTFGNGDGTFQPPVTYATGTTPDDIALGDFNEDGFMDIAVSCLAANVNIFLMDNGTPGVFIPSGTVVTGSGARGIVTKDFNNDNHLDIITSNNSTGSFGVVYGTGTGTFGAATQFTTQPGCFYIISGDFNGDNLPDIATTNETSNSISVSLNNGSGFNACVNYATKSLPNGIRVGDFNEDNILDIAVVEYGDNVFTVFQGIGTGAFLPAVHLTCIGAPRDLLIYDCNGDGFDDAVVSTFIGQVLPVFLGLGNGTFQHRISYPVGNSPQSIHHADFNSDSFEDIVVTNYADNSMQILLNNGAGVYSSGGTFATDLGPKGVYAKDVNGDGKVDVITANATNNTISVFLGNGSGGFSAAANYPANAQSFIVKIGDVNNDGFQDAVVLNATNNFNILLGTGTGTFGAPTPYAGATGGTDLELGLMNGDAFLDVVMTGGGNNKLCVSLNSGTGTFAAITTSNTGTNPKGLALADVNGDGKVDAVVANYGSSNFQRFFGNGSGGFGPIVAAFSSTDTGPTDVELADFNNDGQLDAIGICEVSSSSTGYAPVFTGISGTFTFYQRFSTDMGPVRVTVADVNGDGLKDAAVVNSVSNTVSILMNSTAAVTVNGPLTFCNGSGTTLTATPATTYLWSDGATTPVIAPTSSGAYTVQTWTGFSGWCTSTSTPAVNIVVSSSPVLTLSSNISICSGQSTTLNVSGATTYLWSNGYGTSPTITVSPTATEWYIIEGFGPNGCSKKDSIQVTVVASPNATFTTLNASYCQDAGAVNLVPGTAGGTFSGGGVTGSTFTPSSAPLGSNTITYFVDLGGGCSSTTSQTTIVNATPNANFTGLNPTFCEGAANVTLTPVQSGGTFSGTGVSGNQFSPTTSGAGTFTVTYSITTSGCTSTTNATTTVNALPNASFTGLSANYCNTQPIVTMTPSVSGGSFTGTGVSGSTFNPATANLGANTITYTITNGSGCTNQTTFVSNVFTQPDATFSGLATDYCISSSTPVTLIPTTSGGVFSGPGTSGSSFTPSTANLGTNTITYVITLGSCSATETVQTIVHATPNANFSGLNGTYCANDVVSILSPSTGGGTFSGTGVVGSTFNPATANIGLNTVTYTITDGFGCSNTSSLSTNVVSGPSAIFTGLAVDYCEYNASPITLSPTVGGGTFTGNGMIGNQFTPSTASLGLNTITYQVTGSGCTNSYSLQTTVHVTPNASYTGLNPSYCSGDAVSTLTPTTLGGTFSGSTGVSGLTFNPASATIGSNTVTYTINDGFGCTNTSSLTTTVATSADATFSGLSTDYCASQTVPVILTPVTGGGVFTGSGISGGQFTPSNATIGSNTINYQVINGSCVSNYSFVTTVHSNPNASFSGLNATYCSGDAISTLGPVTSGGTFSGSTGISGITFNPGTASIGVNSVTYTITDGFGCSSIATLATTVNPSSNPTFSGLATDYCASQTAPVTLNPVTSGGVFTGSGMSGTQFTPSTATLGINTINYQVVNGGCISNYSLQTTVHATPNANFSGLNATYCSGDAASTLVPVTSGGSFSGTGIVGSTFQPSSASIGNNFVAYTIIDGFGCTSNSTQSTNVTESLDPNFSGILSDYCQNETTPITIVPVSSGGVFSGNGISGSQFTPSNASLGANTITYQLVNGACTTSSSFVTNIHLIPDASFTGLNATYCNADQNYTLVPAQSGGVFSGPGLTGNVFNPYYAGTGNFAITYTMDDGSGCSDIETQNITIFQSPDASFTGLSSSYCEYDVPATMIPTISGGTFTGTGVTGSQFSPSISGVGLFDISYEISNTNCTSTYTYATTVHATPVVSYSGLNATYCNSGTGSTLVPSPVGGSFTGSGMSGNNFSPAGLLGNYTITYDYSDAFGCSNSYDLTTEVYASEDPFFTGVSPTYCSDEGLVTLIPTSPGGVFSGTGVVGNTFDPSLATIGINNIQYVIGSGSCIGTYSYSTVVLAAPNVAVSINTNSLSVELEFGTSYQWMNCATMTPVAGATNFNFVPPFEGSFAVIATNSNCSDTSDCTNFFLGIKDLSAMNLSYYPNPSSGNLTIEIEQPLSLEIIDMSGRIVATENLSIGATTLELSTVSRGMYQLMFTATNGARSSYPFVKN